MSRIGRMIQGWEDEAVINAAFEILERRAARYGSDLLSTPDSAGKLACLRIGALEHEVFCVLWLDSQNRLIAFEEMFRGTLTQTSVYPREVAKAALRHNAAAAIFAHNHPSGETEPSRADEHLTKLLKEALALFDVRVLDHLVVSGNRRTSMAERGYV